MAQLSIQNDDVIATLQAQRNEAWDAAARAGAACAAAGRQIDELEKELDAAKKQVADLTAPPSAEEMAAAFKPSAQETK